MNPFNRINKLFLIFALIFFVSIMTKADTQDRYVFDSPILQMRFEHITKELRCLVCQNESIAESMAPLAQDLRNEVYVKMQSGQTDEQIKSYLVARYGQFVLFKPALNASTYVLWGFPVFVFVVGFIIIFLLSRRKKQKNDV